ncbi:hypothetical protein IPC97_13160 [Pseudomonas aeruginosa]|nr:hypothetical protein AO893_13770 [Pseudomonas aeruginosa]KSS35828.1 hypothetical protein APB58_08080 [Pseudomonas aeruginosa]PBV24364.1 hypothetical protein CJU32_23645 [Pseudomonas aeruginosa]RPV99763.1 hypothetical protein IPC785_20465 [Pseudomonas aeruginosa]RQA05148.1 hypothetical protein IPC509_17660 [Pseudomonas aeruginosa]
MRITLNRLIKRHIIKTGRDFMPLIRQRPANSLCVSVKMLVQHSKDQKPIISWMGSCLSDLLQRHQISRIRIQRSMLDEFTEFIDQQ